jgi:hypothetical protein
MNMKTIAASLLLATTCVTASRAQEPVGGYRAVGVTSKEVIDAAAFAVRAQQKAMQDRQGGATARLELHAIERAERQVVAGMNYRLRLKVKVNGREKEGEAVVWWQAWRTPQPYQLTSWQWK